MDKIKIEVRYKNMSFNLIREVNGMKMYFNEHGSYAIIVNKEGEVLFELRSDSSQSGSYLEDGIG